MVLLIHRDKGGIKMKNFLLIVIFVAMYISLITINAFGVILIYEVCLMISIQGLSETLDGILAIMLVIPLIMGLDALVLYAHIEMREELK